MLYQLLRCFIYYPTAGKATSVSNGGRTRKMSDIGRHLAATSDIWRQENGGIGAVSVLENPGWVRKLPSQATMSRAVFLDRDGTMIEEKFYLHRPEDVVFFPGVGEALKRLQDADYKLIVITNQSGVGRGYFKLEDVEKVHNHIIRELAKHQVRLHKFYIAPEAPDQPSRGRKPSPQFLFDARDEFSVDLAESFVIGDKLLDLECGWNAGVKKALLVRTGYGREWEQKNPPGLEKAVIVDDLTAAADWILQ
jgi:D-glycero-D-manno-heptose 1,7-bisphosphate phosphatase